MLPLSCSFIRLRRASAAAAADGDLDLLAGGEQRAVVHFRDGDDVLRLRQTDADVRFGDAALRREVERRDAGARIFIGDDQHFLHIGLLGHRAIDRHSHRHGVAVLGDLGKIELDLAVRRLLAAGELLDQLRRIVLGESRYGEPARQHHRPRTDRERLPAVDHQRHFRSPAHGLRRCWLAPLLAHASRDIQFRAGP